MYANLRVKIEGFESFNACEVVIDPREGTISVTQDLNDGNGNYAEPGETRVDPLSALEGTITITADF
jgi:hypothetical protein